MTVEQMRHMLAKKYSDRFVNSLHDGQVVAIYNKILNEGGNFEPEGAPKHKVKDGVQMEMDI